MIENSATFIERWERGSHKALSMAELLRRQGGIVDPLSPEAEELFVDNVLRAVRRILEEFANGEGETEGTFEMANVRPERSGLPFIVFISEKGGARHDVRVKVSRGPRVRDFVATVSVRPDVQVQAGDLSSEDLALLRSWIELNRDVIVQYWDGDILYTEDALAALQPLPKKK